MSDELGIPVAMMIADAYDQIKKQKKEITKLKQQLAERDALILELEKVREFYAMTSNWDEFCSIRECDREYVVKWHEDIGGKLARTPLKNQALLDEIKGRV